MFTLMCVCVSAAICYAASTSAFPELLLSLYVSMRSSHRKGFPQSMAVGVYSQLNQWGQVIVVKGCMKATSGKLT